VLRAILAVFLVNLNNSAFMLILNIYLAKLGYDDSTIASFVSYRFLGVLLLGFPFGIFIRGRRLKPWIMASSLIIPSVSLAILFVLPLGMDVTVKVLFGLWGVGMMFIQVSILPFIMRNAPEEHRSEAISLDFATWSIATIVAGVIISGMDVMVKQLGYDFDESSALFVIVSLTFAGIFFLFGMGEADPEEGDRSTLDLAKIRSYYNWPRILRATLPTVIIAVGAGLTIPFMNLFFFTVFELDYEQFSIMGSLTALMVTVSSLAVPVVRRRLGYTKTIIGTQVLGIGFLVMLAMTEVFRDLPGIFIFAFIAYLFRQPLMNMSGPVSSELTMDYVGKKNQELISALQSSIWSASWFISAKLYQLLRALELEYFKIFLITSLLYSIGTFLYYRLIRHYELVKAEEQPIKQA